MGKIFISDCELVCISEEGANDVDMCLVQNRTC